MVAFEGESFRLCFRRLRKTSFMLATCREWSGIEDDQVFEVSSDAVETVDDLVDDLDEPPWGSTSPLWHHQPLEEARECAESSERYRVLVHRYLVKRRNKVEE